MPPGRSLDRTDLLHPRPAAARGPLSTNAELAERVQPVALGLPAPGAAAGSAKGVIAGYGARLDPVAHRPRPAGLRARAAGAPRPRGDRALRRARAAGTEVVACHALTGDMDYLLHVVVADLDALLALPARPPAQCRRRRRRELELRAACGEGRPRVCRCRECEARAAQGRPVPLRAQPQPAPRGRFVVAPAGLVHDHRADGRSIEQVLQARAGAPLAATELPGPGQLQMPEGVAGGRVRCRGR
jgi:Lrp/AsnC family leucine-responsive transcriptional regulator